MTKGYISVVINTFRYIFTSTPADALQDIINYDGYIAFVGKYITTVDDVETTNYKVLYTIDCDQLTIDDNGKILANIPDFINYSSNNVITIIVPSDILETDVPDLFS